MNTSKLILFFLLSCFFLSTPAVAQWWPIQIESTNNLFFSPTSVKKQDHVIQGKVLINYQNGSIISHEELNCSEKRRRSLSQLFYSGQMAKGKITRSANTKDAEWANVIPGSKGAVLLETICQYLK